MDTYTITNHSSSIVDTHLLIITQGLSKDVRMENASGITSGGDAYLRVYLPNGVLKLGQSIVEKLIFNRSQPTLKPVRYSLDFLSGQGKP